MNVLCQPESRCSRLYRCLMAIRAVINEVFILHSYPDTRAKCDPVTARAFRSDAFPVWPDPKARSLWAECKHRLQWLTVAAPQQQERAKPHWAGVPDETLTSEASSLQSDVWLSVRNLTRCCIASVRLMYALFTADLKKSKHTLKQPPKKLVLEHVCTITKSCLLTVGFFSACATDSTF